MMLAIKKQTSPTLGAYKKPGLNLSDKMIGRDSKLDKTSVHDQSPSRKVKKKVTKHSHSHFKRKDFQTINR